MTTTALWSMVPTPFTPDGCDVDLESLHSLVQDNIASGAGGVVALGVIAEPTALSLREKLDVVGAVIDAASSVAVVASVMTLDPAARDEELRAFDREFGDRLTAIMVPVPDPDPRQVTVALDKVRRACAAPLLLQDYPRATGVEITVADLVTAIAGRDDIVAIKCEAAPTFVRLHELAGETAVMLMAGLGGAGLVDDLSAGATAFACGVTCPELFVRALERWDSGDIDAARSVVAPAGSLINFETQAGSSIGIRKEHWRRKGVITSAATRPPTRSYPPFLDGSSRSYGYVAG
jgi:4-hydroxy-tetrahydrodipicolinate synthase